jgi:hypothetical protein
MPISEPDLASRASMVTGLSCPAAASTSALSRRSSLSVEPAGLAQAEFARPSRGRAPNRDFSFPCYISPEISQSSAELRDLLRELKVLRALWACWILGFG